MWKNKNLIKNSGHKQWKFHINKDFLVTLQCKMFRVFMLHYHQNQDKLLNIWLKQTFQKAIMYFKTSEWQLFGRNLGCYLHYFQYEMRWFRCIFKFPNTKIMPLVLHEFDVSSINVLQWEEFKESKVHLWHLKSNVTDSILKLHWKKFQ